MPKDYKRGKDIMSINIMGYVLLVGMVNSVWLKATPLMPNWQPFPFVYQKPTAKMAGALG